jgi:O-antigen ligase
MDQFSFILYQAVPSVSYILPLYESYGQYQNPHNSYLELLTFAGLPTFAVFIFFLTRVYRAIWKVLDLECEKNTRLVFITICMVFLVICIFSFFKQLLWIWPVNLLFWMLSGIIISLSKSLNHKDSRGQGYIV